MNGNRWVGPGHNSVFEDLSGQSWTVYHAVDRNDPYFADAVGFTKRPVLLDPLDWVNGWPTVRGGLWASDSAQPVPAAQPGTNTTYRMKSPPRDQPAALIPSLSDEFNNALGTQWSWVREPAPGTYSVSPESFNFDTQAADLYVDSNNASILSEAVPIGNYIVETRVKLNLPPEGCCFNYVQAGLVIHNGDDNFIKLVHVSIWETRQTEFAKELSPVLTGYPRYGNTVVSAPGEWTYLRIVRRTNNEAELYTAYTSLDGTNWTRGGTWTHQLGSNAHIGLVSMGGSGFSANFDYVRVYTLED
jgi:arabinan endo-1,5-alpha-L-arabinosidase